ncbi:MAG: hypothetical protein C4576_27180 [Desulfobacteraceae bacterium]|nr:MAG: hypothetical protein C4576_27180 [Desulfobacteraceae bacterium]
MISSSTEKREIRRFGAIAICVFGTLLAVSLWREKIFLSLFFGILSVLGISFLLLPVQSKPLYEAWIRITHLIGRITTTLALVLAYYLVITPTALLKRFFGGRPISLSPDPEASSYWVTRSEPAQPWERFTKRY